MARGRAVARESIADQVAAAPTAQRATDQKEAMSYQSDPGSPSPYTAAGAPQKTNVLAIISLIAAFFVAPAAIVCGHIALSQIKKMGEQGRGLALAGTVLGYVFTVGAIIAVIIYVIAIAALISSGAAAGYSN